MKYGVRITFRPMCALMHDFDWLVKRVWSSVQFGSLWASLVACAVKITTFHFGLIWLLFILQILRINILK